MSSRPAELCGLGVGAIDFPRASVHITETFNVVHRYGDAKRTLVEGPTKSTAGDRVLPMPTWLRDDLAAMLAGRDEIEGHRLLPCSSPQGPGPSRSPDAPRPRSGRRWWQQVCAGQFMRRRWPQQP